ncbi:MAG TPA: UDP-N-acetylmuramoyl-L-alanyl-D-glutamate--2,6-diaminopimelate ligase [Kribbellaceae bacterium]|nr:UDP-N-acetylmuramoyl-L-alanyl-D-glutamate--2,6-diaminopimelate ligase [Kribbellaceae bacterium]
MSTPPAAGGAVAGIRPGRTEPVALEELARALGVPAEASYGAVAVTGVTLDSRSVRAGDLYAALPGAVTHGARFTEAARTAGAVAVLTDAAGAEPAAASGLPVLVVEAPRAVLGAVAARVYGEPTKDVRLLGVTGTNGKTTTTYLLDAVLRRLGPSALIGTIETRVGDEVVKSVRTTPEATDLQALFAVMRERGVGTCAMEVSSHALALGRVDGARFTVAGFTNLSQDHLDFHAGFEDYFAAKASLFTPERCDVAVVNTDDPYGARLAGSVKVELVTVSPSGAAADWRVEHTAAEGQRTRIGIAGPDGERFEVVIALPGDFNVANALIAAVMLRRIGVPAGEIAAGLAEATVPGRMELFTRADRLAVLVDYAHTPDAVALALRAARAATTGKVISVVGCGGDRDRGKRPAMGAAAARNSDVVVITDDNPRSEDPAAIRAAVVEGAREAGGTDVREIGDRRAAIAAAIELGGPGDTVVVLGKGHETGQEIASVVHPFDDRQTVRELLEVRR